MFGNVLQYFVANIAVFGSVLQCFAVFCSILQCFAVCSLLLRDNLKAIFFFREKNKTIVHKLQWENPVIFEENSRDYLAVAEQILPFCAHDAQIVSEVQFCLKEFVRKKRRNCDVFKIKQS